MQEVLVAHTAWATTNPEDEWLITCVDCKATIGTYDSIVPEDVDRDGGSYDLLDAALAAHQAEALAAAGYGPVREAGATELKRIRGELKTLGKNLDSWESQEHTTVTIRHLRSWLARVATR